jgi:hypothetical protein
MPSLEIFREGAVFRRSTKNPKESQRSGHAVLLCIGLKSLCVRARGKKKFTASWRINYDVQRMLVVILLRVRRRCMVYLLIENVYTIEKVYTIEYGSIQK